jgi:hypothetical protein
VHHVSSSSESQLPDTKGSDITTCTVAPNPLGVIWSAVCPKAPDAASLLGGLRAATCPAVPYGPRASNIKKTLAGLPVRLGPRVSNSRTHVSKTPDVMTIMGL